MAQDNNITLSGLVDKMKAMPGSLACLSRPGCSALPRPVIFAFIWAAMLKIAKIPDSVAVQLPPPPTFTASVALVVRTFGGAVSTLIPFFRSVEKFWPYQRWPVIIVFDADHEADRALAAALVPSWAKVEFEHLPPLSKEWVELRRLGSRRFGWQRASWSHFNLDRYTDADFVAQADSDIIFHTFVDEELLFDDARRPRVTGISHWSDFGPVLRSLDLQTDFDFMVAQPMLLRRGDFQRTRDFVARKMRAKDFNEAYALLTHAVMKNETNAIRAGTRHVLSQQSVMGGYLWAFRREMYSWHILWRSPPGRQWNAGSPYPKEPELMHRCPQIFSASHLNCWNDGTGRCAGLKHGDDQVAVPVSERVPTQVQGGQHYLVKSAWILAAALCSVRQEAQRTARFRLDGDVQRAVDGFVLPDFPFRSENHSTRESSASELCKKALGPAEPESFLFGLSNVTHWPTGPQETSAYCYSREELFERWQHHVLLSFSQEVDTGDTPGLG